MIENFVTVDLMKDFATVVLLTVIVTQFFKGAADTIFQKLFKTTIQTKYLAFFWAVLIVTLSYWYDDKLSDPEQWPLVFLSAVIVTITAMKSFEVASDNKTIFKK